MRGSIQNLLQRFLQSDNTGSIGDLFRAMPTIETERLLLRKVRYSDQQDIYAWCSDPQVARYVLWSPHQRISETRNYIHYLKARSSAGCPSSWVIVHKATGKVIGSIGFMWVDTENRSSEVGYSLARDFWGQGFATEALSPVIHFAFDSLKLNRVEAQHDIRNPASGRVMEKNGMRKEGVLRGRIRNKGEFIDVALYAILKKDVQWER